MCKTFPAFSELETWFDFLVISLTVTHDTRIVTNLLHSETEGCETFFLSLNIMSNFSFISLVNIISAFRVDFVLVLIDWCGRPLPWHLYLLTFHTHTPELQSWPSQIYMSEWFWISWFLGCERKERAMINKYRIWSPSVQHSSRQCSPDSRQRRLFRRGLISTLLGCWAALTCHGWSW